MDKDTTVTEEEISASLRRKEEIGLNDDLDDLVSFEGSCGTLSNLSASSAMSTTMTALKQKRIKIIESIKSVLESSNVECSTPNTSLTFDEQLLTSTPCQEHNVPPAAKFLKDWRGFSKIEELHEEDDSSEPPVRYEEAFQSLKEILGESQDMLGAYESALDVYQKNEDQKLEEIMSFFEVRQDSTAASHNYTVIDLVSTTLDDNDNTINSIPDSSATLVNETVIEKETDASETSKKVLDPKDPENVIIAAEDGANADATLVNEEDEDRLLASDDEEQGPAAAAAPVESKKVWTNFVSNDPEENADNNDPKWELLRNLGTDYDRYKAVRERWRNIEIPNPKKDLTCRCQRIPMQTSQPVALTETRKRPLSPDSNFDSKKLKVEPCTMLFDRNITDVLTNLELQKQMLDNEQKRCITSLADTQRLEQINAYHRHISEQERRSMKDRHCKEAYAVVKNFRMRRDHLLQSTRQQITALRRAAAEVQEFHEFYPVTNESGERGDDKNSMTYLTSIEVEEILEIEKMFSRFEEFYSGATCYEQQC